MYRQPSRPGRSTPYLVAGAAVLVLLIGVWLGGHPGWLPPPLRSAFVSQPPESQVDRVLSLLSKEYYRPLDTRTLVDKGLVAAVASLDDPYSHYYPPAQYKSFVQETNPTDSGIGVEVLPNSHGLAVQEVFPGSPAAHAGLVSGDLIVAVGTTTLAGKSVADAATLIQGKPGTKVGLTVVSGSHRRTVELTRETISVPVTTSRLLSYNGVEIGYVGLASFTANAGSQVRSQVHKLLAEHAEALILDLRENGGGLLQQAVAVASVFIPSGTVVTTRGRDVRTQVYDATGGAIPTKIPLVVLVDGGTASSAEIVTAALKERGRAEVVGTHTYGKGVFQEIQSLPGGGALDITVGRYYPPDGHNLGGPGVSRGHGVTPNVYAATKPKVAPLTPGDTALKTAERVVAAKVQ
jgi:carboxyl-terminal processing protease